MEVIKSLDTYPSSSLLFKFPSSSDKFATILACNCPRDLVAKTCDCSRVGWCRDAVPHLVRAFHGTKLSHSKIA